MTTAPHPAQNQKNQGSIPKKAPSTLAPTTTPLAFWLLGSTTCDNPSAISQEMLLAQARYVDYLGECEDVRNHIAKSYCVVLPSSYKEGVPRVLLEAMSMGKPIITTDTNGCKECILPPLRPYENLLLGQNGILIPKKDSKALARAMGFLANMEDKDYQAMAQASRYYAKERFDIKHTIAAYQNALTTYCGENPHASPTQGATPHATPATNHPTRAKSLNLAFLSNSCFGMYNFRLSVLKALQEAGHTIHIIAPNDGNFAHKLTQEGFFFHHISIDSKGLNPIKDLATTLSIKKLFKSLSPDMIFNYTIKPVIYGTLTAGKTPCIAITTGLGYVFVQGGFKRKILKLLVSTLYKIALKNAKEVWFLNTDDKEEFLKAKILPQAKARILDSEGVDTDFFAPQTTPFATQSPSPQTPAKTPATQDSTTPHPASNPTTQPLAQAPTTKTCEPTPSTPQPKAFLLIARMLWDKGIGEFIEAAKILKKAPTTKNTTAKSTTPEAPRP